MFKALVFRAAMLAGAACAAWFGFFFLAVVPSDNIFGALGYSVAGLGCLAMAVIFLLRCVKGD